MYPRHGSWKDKLLLRFSKVAGFKWSAIVFGLGRNLRDEYFKTSADKTKTGGKWKNMSFGILGELIPSVFSGE